MVDDDDEGASRIPYAHDGPIYDPGDSPEYTMEGYKRDLEPPAPIPPVSTEREILEEILGRVRRIEELLEKGDPQVPPWWASS